MSAQTIERVVNYNNMFSESTIHPSYQYRFKQDMKYRQPAPLPPVTYVEANTAANLELAVTGADRHKYFKVPLVPRQHLAEVKLASSVTPSLLPSGVSGIATANSAASATAAAAAGLQQLQRSSYSAPSGEGEDVQLALARQSLQSQSGAGAGGGFYREPRAKDMATQSDYRENEAQTDPYTPEYYVAEGETDPEVLALTALKQQNGRFLIGQEELKIIDRVRRRRAVEAQLPTSDDTKDFEKRLQMLRDLEIVEWKEREEEIAAEQARNLEVLKAALWHREERIEQSNAEKLQRFQEMKQQDLQYRLAKLEEKKLQELRKIIKKYDNPERKPQKRDIIFEHAFSGSRHHMPVRREGRIGDVPIADDIRPIMLSNPFTIEHVEHNQVRKLIKTAPGGRPLSPSQELKKALEPKSYLTAKERKELEVKNDVNHAYDLLNKTKKNNQRDIDTLRELYKATPRVVRPPTPTLQVDDDDDELDNAVVFIQRLMRGRAVQINLAEGKERSISLIDELIAVERIKEREKFAKKDQQEEMAAAEREKKRVMRLMADNIQGQIVSRALDYLSKELVRQREMHKIEQLMTRAELQRSEREAAEQALRATEEAQRRVQDEEYSQLMEINDSTVTTYLDQIFADTADRLAYELALREVQKDLLDERQSFEKRRTEEAAHRMRSSLNQDTPDTDELEIKSLVAQFLLPQVKRSALRRRVENVFHRKYIKSAQEAAFSALEEVEQKLG